MRYRLSTSRALSASGMFRLASYPDLLVRRAAAPRDGSPGETRFLEEAVLRKRDPVTAVPVLSSFGPVHTEPGHDAGDRQVTEHHEAIADTFPFERPRDPLCPDPGTEHQPITAARRTSTSGDASGDTA